jgi:hypothetical protein
MPNPSEKEPIKITLDDLANVSIPETSVVSPVSSATGAKSYGTITATAEQFVPVSEEREAFSCKAGSTLAWRDWWARSSGGRSANRDLLTAVAGCSIGEIL